MKEINKCFFSTIWDEIPLERIFAQCQTADTNFTEIYIEKSYQTDIKVSEEKLEKCLYGEDQGASIRIFANNQILFGYTQDLSLKGFHSLAEQISSSLPKKKVLSPCSLKPPCFHPCKSSPIKIWPKEINLSEKIQKTLICDQAARKNFKYIKEVSVNYSDEQKDVMIFNSKGLQLAFSSAKTYLGATSVAKKNQTTQTGFEPLGGVIGWEIFSKNDPKQIGLKASQQAEGLLEAQFAPMGKMPVILSAKAGGTFVHEVLGHALEADAIDDGISIFEDSLGKKISKTPLTVMDNPTLPHLGGSYDFDDEGTPAKPKVLVKDGILKSFLLDCRTGTELNFPSTGNGRREDYRSKPIPRMSNIFIKPMKKDPQNIIRSLSKGLLITQLGGGEVDTVTGSFIFEILEGFFLKNGKKEAPIRGASLIGNIKEVLDQELQIGNDLEFSLGGCEKSGQDVWVSDGQPTMLIPEITIGGQEI